MVVNVSEEKTFRTTASRLGYKVSRRMRKDGHFRVWFLGAMNGK